MPAHAQEQEKVPVASSSVMEDDDYDCRKTAPSWVVDIENRLSEDGVADPAKEAAVWRKHSVYRVPAHVKKNGKKRTTSPYGPQLVSLGPFHRDNPELPPEMEAHKARALLHLLRRTGASLRGLVAALEAEEVAGRLQDAYMDLDERWRRDRDAFLRVMVVDGCFLLEVMRTAAGGAPPDYAANDPIFSCHGELYMFPYVRRDMLVMENQLPLLVLQRLVAVVGAGPDAATDDAINNMVLQFVSLAPDPPELVGGGLALHPIDACHRSLLHGNTPRHEVCKGVRRRDEFVPSATELHQSGIKFARSPTRSLHDVRFDRGGVLRIPPLAVDETTEHKLLSLMAFERLHADAGANEVTAYVFFMDNVIKSAADARMLASKGVLSNGLGDDKVLAKMFNRLARRAVLDKRSPLRAVHGEVNAYREKRWNEWRASLIQNHAGNPWAIVSLVAAVFLLVLTVVQTVYTVLPYYDQQQLPPIKGWRPYFHDEL